MPESWGSDEAVKLLIEGRDMSKTGNIAKAEEILRKAIDLSADDLEVRGAATYRLGQLRELRGDI